MSEEDNFLQLRREREPRTAPALLNSGAAAGFDPSGGLVQTKAVSFSSRHVQRVNVHGRGSPRDRELPGDPDLGALDELPGVPVLLHDGTSGQGSVGVFVVDTLSNVKLHLQDAAGEYRREGMS